MDHVDSAGSDESDWPGTTHGASFRALPVR